MRKERPFETRVHYSERQPDNDKNQVNDIGVNANEHIQRCKGLKQHPVRHHQQKLPPKDSVMIAFDQLKELFETQNLIILNGNGWKDHKQRRKNNSKNKRNQDRRCNRQISQADGIKE